MSGKTEQIIPGIYRHYKGQRYEVLGEGIHTETGELGVFYRAFENHPEGKHSKGDFFFRPREMFLEDVVLDGKTVPKFRLVIKK